MIITIFAILLTACSTEEYIQAADDNNGYGYTISNHSVDDIIAYIAPIIFEYMNPRRQTLGLHPVDYYDERFHHFEENIILGYTYFDFAGDGTYSLVAFYIAGNPAGGDLSIGVDSAVYAKIDGEWQQAWFFSGALELRQVSPFIFWCRQENRGIYALLAIGFGVATIDVAQLITVRHGELQVLRTDFQDARPDWYWEWIEAGSPFYWMDNK